MRVLPALILLAVFLTFTSITSAQTASTAATAQQKALGKRDALQQKMDAVKEKIASREAAFKNKLSKFRDKDKAALVERINTTLSQINQKRTADMTNYVNRMSEILSKVEARAGSNSDASASAAIANAKASITSAKQAVESQAQNDYTIEVSSESTVRADAKKARDKLHEDLQATRKTVVDAKQAVAEAIRSVAKSLGGFNGQ